MWKVPASCGLWTVWHLQTGIFLVCDIKSCWKTPKPGTAVHIFSPYKALLAWSVVLVWCKTAMQPVSLCSWSVKDIHTLRKADQHNPLFSSSLSWSLTASPVPWPCGEQQVGELPWQQLMGCFHARGAGSAPSGNRAPGSSLCAYCHVWSYLR